MTAQATAWNPVVDETARLGSQARNALPFPACACISLSRAPSPVSLVFLFSVGISDPAGVVNTWRVPAGRQNLDATSPEREAMLLALLIHPWSPTTSSAISTARVGEVVVPV